MKKKIPEFKNEAEETEFWSTHDSSDYIDWGKAPKVIFKKLKPTTKNISIRLPTGLIEVLKYIANKKDVPYQSLLKIYLSERITKELSFKPSQQPIEPLQ